MINHDNITRSSRDGKSYGSPSNFQARGKRRSPQGRVGGQVRRYPLLLLIRLRLIVSILTVVLGLASPSILGAIVKARLTRKPTGEGDETGAISSFTITN